MKLHISPDGQEQGGRLPASNRPGLALHSQPMMAIHSGSPAIVASGADNLQHLKHSLGIKPLRSISRPDGEGVGPSRDMSEEVSHRGIHRSSDTRHTSLTEAHPNNNGNTELHTQCSDQTNAVESVGALHHSNARNPCSQGGPT